MASRSNSRTDSRTDSKDVEIGLVDRPTSSDTIQAPQRSSFLKLATVRESGGVAYENDEDAITTIRRRSIDNLNAASTLAVEISKTEDNFEYSKGLTEAEAEERLD